MGTTSCGCVAIDATGNVGVSYYTGSGQRFVRNPGGTSSVSELLPFAPIALGCHMSFDSTGRARLSYLVDAGTLSPGFFTREHDGGWISEPVTVPTGFERSGRVVGEYYNFALDTDDQPHFVLVRRAAPGGPRIFSWTARRPDGGWTSEDIAVAGDSQTSPRPPIAFDACGRPAIVAHAGATTPQFWLRVGANDWRRTDLGAGYAHNEWLVATPQGFWAAFPSGEARFIGPGGVTSAPPPPSPTLFVFGLAIEPYTQAPWFLGATSGGRGVTRLEGTRYQRGGTYGYGDTCGDLAIGHDGRVHLILGGGGTGLTYSTFGP